jgi:hypothetical protein
LGEILKEDMNMSDSQENAENCKLRAFEKNNYFYGKLMTVRDFVLEQNYVNDKRWLINNLLFGSGTVCGLNVSLKNGTNIVIEPGFAIDKCGREIILPENVSLTLSANDTPSNGNKKAIYISYKECPKERVRAQTASTCDEVCANNRVEESYDIEIKDVTEDGSTNEDICGKWTNHTSNVFIPESGELKFKRKVKKYVSEGDFFEVYLELTNLNSNPTSIPDITDIIPTGLKFVEGSNIIGGTIPFGETIKKWYVVKVEKPTPTKIFTLKATINGANDPRSDSIIEVKSPAEISEQLFKKLITSWTKPCLEENIDSEVKIAELSLGTDGSIIVDNTKRKLVNNNKYMTKMLECLRVQASALEDQTLGIKEKLAPSKIKLVAKPDKIDADGVTSEITITVTNDAEVELPGIDVKLISTLGTIDSIVTTETDGSVKAILTSGPISGIATIMATTGIGTAVTQVEFLSTNGSIEGIVKVEGTGASIPDATVSVGSITKTTIGDGKFLLENVPYGNQVVRAFAEKYEEGSLRVSVPKGETRSGIIFYLTAISTIGEITGRVLDKDGNVMETEVTVTGGDSITNADENGNYILSNVTARDTPITVTASARGYQTQTQSAKVRADHTTSGIDFKLEIATGTIKGIVTTSFKRMVKELAIESISVIPERRVPGDIGLPIGSKGIPDASVSVVGMDLSVMTDEFGKYEIKNVPLGTRTVSVSAENYNASTSSVFVEEKTITLNFQLTKLVTTGTVTGRVTTIIARIVKNNTRSLPAIVAMDPGARLIDLPNIIQEEVGIEGAIVTVAGKSVVTEASGNYTILNVPSGSQEVSASATGYVAQKGTVSVAAAGTATANFQLVMAISRGTISGKVTQYSGKTTRCIAGPPGIIPVVGIKGAVVSVAGTNLTAITEDLGNYIISDVPTGTYTLNASAQGYNTGTQGATVNENLTIAVNFALVLLPTTGEISGRVTNMSGEPIFSAGVNLAEVGDSVLTDESGTYRFPNVLPGSYTVNVTASGYNNPSRTVSVNAGQTTSADFKLEKVTNGTIIGIITDSENKGITGARVYVGVTKLSATTDNSGKYEISNVPKGWHEVVANADLFKTGTIEIEVFAGKIVTVDFKLEKIDYGAIKGIITDIENKGIFGARVTVENTNFSATTDSYGNYSMYNVPQGWHALEIRADLYIAVGAEINVVAGKEVTKDFKLEKTPILEPIYRKSVSISECPSGRPTIVPKSEVSKAKSACLAGRPTIAPVKETKTPIKAKKGTKK